MTLTNFFFKCQLEPDNSQVMRGLFQEMFGVQAQICERFLRQISPALFGVFHMEIAIKQLAQVASTLVQPISKSALILIHLPHFGFVLYFCAQQHSLRTLMWAGPVWTKLSCSQIKLELKLIA